MPSKKTQPPTRGGDAATPVEKWWVAVGRLAQVQLVCSLLMQLSYVAFPAYNFVLALWCLLVCTPTWSAKHARLAPLHMIALSFSVVTDIIWMSLWVSGRVFFDQFCNANAVSIVSCGGASDHFPGCSTNQFALFTLIINLLAKCATVMSLQRIHVLAARSRVKPRNQAPATDGTSDAPSAGGMDAEVSVMTMQEPGPAAHGFTDSS
ncbi:hypothetical protein BBJ28_00013659 [Nothophytophthora sp. Chile5]|nr:hypothetical protein BBJ28_00013659 [Nothophytophthora sp. Chile5]